jgi:hypothetical protein
MLILSVFFGLGGPISELAYIPDWWAPITFTGHIIGLEDFIFGFALAGIATSIVPFTTKKKQTKNKNKVSSNSPYNHLLRIILHPQYKHILRITPWISSPTCIYHLQKTRPNQKSPPRGNLSNHYIHLHIPIDINHPTRIHHRVLDTEQELVYQLDLQHSIRRIYLGIHYGSIHSPHRPITI